MRASAGSETSYDEFEDYYVRRAFIIKVCTILSMLFLITTSVVVVFVLVESVKDWADEHQWLFYVSIGVTSVIMLALLCCQAVARTVPVNYVLLLTFAVFKSILVGYLAMMYAPLAVLVAFGVATCICIVLILFAIQTRIDFTICGGVLLAGVVILLIMSIVGIFFPNRVLLLVICALGLLLFSLFLVFDIQMMVGGKHRNQYSPEDYIVAALTIYIDIINIFIYILILLGLIDG